MHTPYTLDINRDFKITALELMREIERRNSENLPALKGLILSSPSNPTGAMLSEKELKELCELCDKHKIIFISDGCNTNPNSVAAQH